MGDSGNSTCPDLDTIVDFNDVNRFLGLAIFIFSSLYYGATIGWFYHRRKNKYLHTRHFGMMVCSALGGFVQIVAGPLTNFITRSEMPCNLFLILVYSVVPLSTGPLAVRLVLFYNRARYGAHLSSVSSSIRDEEKSGKRKLAVQMSFKKKTEIERLNAFVRMGCCCFGDRDHNRIANEANDDEDNSPTRTRRSSTTMNALHFSTSRIFGYSLLSVFLALALAMVLKFMLQGNNPYGFTTNCKGCTIGGRDFMPLMIQMVIIFSVGLAMLIVLRKAQDPLGILFELRLCWFGGLLTVMGAGLSVVDPMSLREDGIFDWMYIVSAAALFVHTIQCPLQVYYSYKAPARIELAKDGVTLEQVLEDDEFRTILRQYLVTEFSLENLFFLEAVDNFKEAFGTSSGTENVARAQDIKESYIQYGSVLEVNISSSTRNALVNKITYGMQDVDQDIFDVAYKEIYHLLSSDSFPRFCKSRFFLTHMEDRKQITIPAL